MEVFCVFQSILDCSNDDELVDAPLTLARQDKVKQCSGKSNSSGLVPACFDWLRQCTYDVPCRQEESSVYYQKVNPFISWRRNG